MDKNRILSARFLGFSKYLGIITVVSFILFLIINAFNTGNDILFWVSYTLLMLSIIGLIQSVCLYFIGKYYAKKSK